MRGGSYAVNSNELLSTKPFVPKYSVETVTVAELVVAWLIQCIIIVALQGTLVWLLILEMAE